MATKIKMNTIEAQIAFIDNAVAMETGIDLRKKAQDAIHRRAAYRAIGTMLADGIGFDQADNSLVLVPQKEIVH